MIPGEVLLMADPVPWIATGPGNGPGAPGAAWANCGIPGYIGKPSGFSEYLYILFFFFLKQVHHVSNMFFRDLYAFNKVVYT